MAIGQEIEPAPHWWKESALTTTPTLLQTMNVHFSNAKYWLNSGKVSKHFANQRTWNNQGMVTEIPSYILNKRPLLCRCPYCLSSPWSYVSWSPVFGPLGMGVSILHISFDDITIEVSIHKVTIYQDCPPIFICTNGEVKVDVRTE